MISTKTLTTTKGISTAALMLLLAGSPVFAVGQTSSTQSTAPETTSTQNVMRLEAKNNKDCDPGLTKRESKDKKKAKPHAKPTPSKEEQEFERVLLGIFG